MNAPRRKITVHDLKGIARVVPPPKPEPLARDHQPTRKPDAAMVALNAALDNAMKGEAAQAYAARAWLGEVFPASFGLRPMRPLAQNIRKAVFAALTDKQRRFPPEVIAEAIRMFMHSTDYRHAVSLGESRRLNLDGSDAGAVSHDDREGARQYLAARQSRRAGGR
jgi:sRNA-binding protein